MRIHLTALAAVLALMFTGASGAHATKQPARAPLTFVLAGQSNMAGYGPVEQSAAPNIHITAWSGSGWVPATDPLPYGMPGTEPGLPFANAVQRATGRDVRLVQCAVGSTALAVWEPRGAMYDACVARVRAAGVKTVSGVLFFQGESDANQNADVATRWAAGFGWFVSGVRSDFHRKQLPVVFAQIGTFADRNIFPYWDAVKAEQAAYKARAVSMVRTDDLEQQPGTPHFTTASYRVIGTRFAAAWLTIAKLPRFAR